MRNSSLFCNQPRFFGKEEQGILYVDVIFTSPDKSRSRRTLTERCKDRRLVQCDKLKKKSVNYFVNFDGF